MAKLVTQCVLWGLLASLLAGCLSTPARPVAPATVPVVSVAQVATEVPPTALPTAIPATSVPPTPTIAIQRPGFTCQAEPGGEHIQHTVEAQLDYIGMVMNVSQQIHYRNETEVALQQLVLDASANTIAGVFFLDTLTIGGFEADYRLTSNRLEIDLPTRLQPGCTLTLELRFDLAIPHVDSGYALLRGYFSYGPRQVNLGHWLPTPAARFNNAWWLPDPQPVGEQQVLEQADWDLTLRVANANPTLQVAVPGTITRPDDHTWRIVHRSARDLTLSLSGQYQVKEARTADGTLIQVYHFDGVDVVLADGTIMNGGTHALNQTVRAMEHFAAAFGPYPYERLIVVQGDFPDGMEFSGLFFVGTRWFETFQGGVQNYLTIITVHEAAHQWWYMRVGNDSAFAPWLDEALATYSEYLFYERYYPGLRDWWWTFRVAWFAPSGSVDSSVYQFDSARAYINAIYLRGAEMLHALRGDVGDAAFYDLLAAYAQAGDGQIATPDLFWSLFTPEQLQAARGTRTEFLQIPD